MVSIIITAYKEEKTIAKLIDCLFNPQHKNLPQTEFEFILACPDQETLFAVKNKLQEINFNLKNFVYVKDPKLGKPTALEMCFQVAKGEIFILTDGDVQKIEDESIPKLISKIQSNEKFGAVTGRPISYDDKTTMFGYFGHLLADAAHDKRMKTISDNQNGFFVISGYLTCIRKPNFQVPADILSDDAYMSYKFRELGYMIKYEPEARVYIKYPKNLNDWLKQKARSLGGYVQLNKIGIINVSNKTRSFWGEIGYSLFPVRYATNLKEFVWSLILYPLRLYLWLRVFVERKILNKDFQKTWTRIESTK